MEEQLQNPNQLAFPMHSTPLFSFNPNNFPYTLTCEQSPVVKDGEVFLNIVSNPANSNINCPKIRTPAKLPIYLEKTLDEVNFTVATGCFCRFKNCLEDLDPEMVYRHRKCVSKLSKADHNMFLMGTMATCLTKTKGPAQKYIKYTFGGKRVCKEAFLYLQCSTHKQIMEVRDHLMAYGVSRMTNDSVRNSITCTEAYKHVKQFLARYVECNMGKENICTGRNVLLPLGTTKKGVHESYKAYMQKYKPGVKFFSYGTFSSILTNHFPHIIFCTFGRNVLLQQVKIKDEKVEGPTWTVTTHQVVPFEDKKFNVTRF